MKTINVTFETYEHEVLVSKKGGRSWREFILSLVKQKGEDE